MKKVILVTGLSGAGKSSASIILEDMGYHCIDQYPVQLIDKLVDLIESSNDSKYENTALTIPLNDYHNFELAFNGSEVKIIPLFLEANEEILLSRYKSTRRTHPMLLSNKANTLEESIHIEIDNLTSAKTKNAISIDTSFLEFKELKSKLEEYFNLNNNFDTLSLTFLSFGYKHGVPLDADLMIDVRFLPNPYWEASLRLYSGDDDCVYDYVMNKPETIMFLQKSETYLEYLLEQYVKEGKNHLTVAIGCTGGQHRSVSITNYLYDKYNSKFRCYKYHRDRVDYYE